MTAKLPRLDDYIRIREFTQRKLLEVERELAKFDSGWQPYRKAAPERWPTADEGFRFPAKTG